MQSGAHCTETILRGLFNTLKHGSAGNNGKQPGQGFANVMTDTLLILQEQHQVYKRPASITVISKVKMQIQCHQRASN
uniref:Uncharacterized protein n=1 Tax=Anguilla anguilla TaxID=7936 RepID=A0A0E9X538_ANGAN